MSARIEHTFSICLTDIPKHCIQKGKNGKKYLSLRLIKFASPNKYGKDGMVTVDIPKDKWENGNTYILGSSKSHELYEKERQEQAPSQAPQETQTTTDSTVPQEQEEGNLPF